MLMLVNASESTIYAVQTSSETWNWRLNCSALGHCSAWPNELAGHWANSRVAAVCAGSSYAKYNRRAWSVHAGLFYNAPIAKGVQPYNTDVCGATEQTFVVLWLKITFHITLSQLKSINLHKPWPITVHKSTNTVCYYTWQAHALESIHT